MARGPSKIATKPKGAGRLNHHQHIAWLRLIRSENVGPATFRALVNEFGGAEAAIDALPLFFPARTDAPTSAFAPRPKPRPSSQRRIASEQCCLRRAWISARARPGGCAAAAALRQRQARARQYSHRRHCRRPQRLGGRAKIHPSDRHRARARRLRHRLGTSPRYRYGVAHGSLGTRHRRRAGWRHRHRVSARECGVAARDRRARPPDQRALPASRHAARISRGATG